MRTGSDARVQDPGTPDEYIEHGNVEVLRKETGLECRDHDSEDP